MILYQVTWDNNEPYEDHMTWSTVFTTLAKAKEWYDLQTESLDCSCTWSLYSFESDNPQTDYTLIESKDIAESWDSYIENMGHYESDEPDYEQMAKDWENNHAVLLDF